MSRRSHSGPRDSGLLVSLTQTIRLPWLAAGCLTALFMGLNLLVVQQSGTVPYPSETAAGLCARTGLDNGVYVLRGWPVGYVGYNIDPCIAGGSLFAPASFLIDVTFWCIVSAAIVYGVQKLRTVL